MSDARIAATNRAAAAPIVGTAPGCDLLNVGRHEPRETPTVARHWIRAVPPARTDEDACHGKHRAFAKYAGVGQRVVPVPA